MEKYITFRLKCEPRITVSAPSTSVHVVEGGYGIVFWNENSSLNTIVMPSDVWWKEDEQ